MHRKLITSTELGKKISISAVKMNELLYAKHILNKRGRPSKKDPSKFKPFWEILDFRYGTNIPSRHGGGTVKFYEDMSDELLALLSSVGLEK